jgi:hypothetical protein
MDGIHCRATPAGGARKRGWGCVFSLTLACLSTASFADDSDVAIEVPSGQPVSFLEMLWDRPGFGLFYRYRFLAPELGEPGRGFDDVAADLEHLCNAFAIPRLAQTGPQPSQIVISLSSAPVEFGESAPDITQYFEAYSVEDGRCIWEVF